LRNFQFFSDSPYYLSERLFHTRARLNLFSAFRHGENIVICCRQWTKGQLPTNAKPDEIQDDADVQMIKRGICGVK